MKTPAPALTAAAQILQSRVVRAVRPKGTQGMAWQSDAWMYYDIVGEFSMGVDLQAWAVSQGQLVAAIDVPNQDEPEILSGEPEIEGGPQPTEADRIAADLVAGFAGGTSGQQQLLRRVATQLLVSAESFIVGRDMEDGTQKWSVYSREEIRYSQAGYRVDDGIEKFLLSEDDVLIRVWMPHAKRRQEPRSGTKALLPVLAEIHALTQSITAQVDSRLAGAGLLILPASVELVGSQNKNTEATAGDQFVAEFIDMMVTPIKDRDSAAAVVPIIIKVPDDAVGKIQHIRFEATTDMHDADKREAAVTRLARGMDLPPEQITGMGDANHWTGWILAEQTIKGPVSSLLAVIVDALTIGWYRPALQEAYDDAGIADAVEDQMVWFSTTALEQRPDRSEQAVNVFDRGGLSLSALVRENGFDDDDMPDPEELLRILLFMLVKARPELAVPLIERAGLLDQILAAAPGVAVDPVEDPPVVDETNPDARALPERDSGAPGVDAGAA